MINWTILMAVKGLKFAILAALSLISHVADLGCPSASCSVADSAPVTVVAEAASVRMTEESAVMVVVATNHAARIRRLVPPVRVELTFTPDLLFPPKRDPSL